MFITDMVRNISWLTRRSRTVQPNDSVMPVDAVDAPQPVHAKRDREARQDLVVIVAHGPAAGAAVEAAELAAAEQAAAVAQRAAGVAGGGAGDGSPAATAASTPAESLPEYNASGEELDNKPPHIDVKV